MTPKQILDLKNRFETSSSAEARDICELADFALNNLQNKIQIENDTLNAVAAWHEAEALHWKECTKKQREYCNGDSVIRCEIRQYEHQFSASKFRLWAQEQQPLMDKTK